MAFSDVYSPPTPPPLTKYDVFISFNGKDTRNGFTSHLHSALCRNQIETFIDYRIEKGGEIWEELVQAIRDSSVYLVIFSEHYASSKWCLRELAEIIELTNMVEKGHHHIIPVFYRIEPTHVRKQTGSYYSVFAEYDRNLDYRLVRQWRKALFHAANISGFEYNHHHSRTESDFIEGIVQMIVRKLDQKYTSELRSPFIHDQNYASIESVLTHSQEVRTIGIWGMGGIGKTTIAAAIFQEFSPKYEGSCFLANVREESSRHGLNYIFNRLLSELLHEHVHITTPKIVSSAILRRLRHKKVFIVLDDVNTSELLENLLGVGQDYLGLGSKVIVTTRDKHVLLSRSVDHIHQVTEMNDENSLKLFSLNAFTRNHPPENEYWELSKRALAYARGNPLALKVLGSFLHSKTEKEWDNALTKLKRIPNADIQKVLRLSFNELDDTEKDIFLDIACFFKGEEKEKVIRILNECGFFADIGIRNLLDKALISIATNQSIQMHDLIQEMGHKIVCEESLKNPGKRSRVWHPDEICDILKNDEGSATIETIYLDMTEWTEICISSDALRKMPKLRLLAFANDNGFGQKRVDYTLSLPTNLELPNNLRYIQWDGCPLKSLSTTSWPSKLVELSMPYSDLEKLWDEPLNFPSLELIYLASSKRMIECPDLSGAPNLKEVWVNGCDKLTHLHPSILSLPKLSGLCVFGCKELKSLSCTTCSPSLRDVVAYGCPNLQEFSIPISKDNSHINLHLRSTALKQLPSSIVHLQNLDNFSFPISDLLMDLPEKYTKQIMLSDPNNHESDSVATLSRILPSPMFHYLKELKFDGCQSLTELPDNISLLSSLLVIRLHNTNIMTFPENIKTLPRLKIVLLCHCERLQHVPALPPSVHHFKAWDCKSLSTVSSSTSELKRQHGTTFIFVNCVNLDEESCNTILEDAIVRMDTRAKTQQLSPRLEENRNEERTVVDDDDGFLSEDNANVGKVCYFLPIRGSKLGGLFHRGSSQNSISIQLPQGSNFFGFIFYLVVPPIQPCNTGGDLDIRFGFECYLETSWGQRTHIASSSLIEWSCEFYYRYQMNLLSDHVLLWYDSQCCKQIMEIIRGRKAIDDDDQNANLEVKFFARLPNKEQVVIKECGIRWIYTNMEKEPRGCSFKRSREVFELEAIASPNEEKGFESDDEEEELVPPAKKFKHSLMEVESVENLRKKLEQLLHIEFDGGFLSAEIKLGYNV
ncbi:TMV resistance protein N-like [Arachis hypogaea]|uniref:TMV resistance protein N-like n=1 Tax=Arachis hypogaea TaxID=3818 RepID=UPI003B21E4BD